ncbi:MAG: LacI family DNA-binding transcriptional regulator [Sinomonas sp.]|nr:LacI family DNA-binding transcriptional regulator [Sinomonas sp.]
MNDVAARAGVSQATVSLVLNHAEGGRFTKETKAKVEQAVRELGYRPNAHARVLREGVAGMIGFIGHSVATAPMAGMIIAGAQERAWEAGMLVLTVETSGDRDIERASIEAMLSYSVAGVVYAGMYNRNLEVPGILRGSKAVVLNSMDASGVFPSVAPDEERGGYTATKVLLDAGHRRIGLINIETLKSGLPAAVGRYRGYIRALAEAGIEPDSGIVRFGHGSEEHGYVHATELLSLENRPTAIFCVNDRTAWGAYQAAGELGLRIPEDLSIVGFDNQDILAPNLRPGLTTLDLPFKAMGRRAVEILLEGAPLEGRVELFECPVVARGSVKELKETQ